MSLFETEVSQYSRNYIAGMNALEANRASIDVVEQIGEMLRSSGIANHSHIHAHTHYNPPQLSMWVHIYNKAAFLPRLVEQLHALTIAKAGEIVLSEEERGARYIIRLAGLHDIDISFADEEITHSQLKAALEGLVTA